MRRTLILRVRLPFNMIISMIVAIGKNREIGLGNKMLWHVKEDFKNFKKVTMGHHMLMGRKTFESIGRPLPGRTTIILTRDKNYTQADCLVVHSVDQGIALAKGRAETELFICGGANIYEQFLDKTEKLYLSRIDFEGEADTFFPEFESYHWETLEECEFAAGEKSPAWSYYVVQKATDKKIDSLFDGEMV
jgi:dihydrofolate reductase